MRKILLILSVILSMGVALAAPADYNIEAVRQYNQGLEQYRIGAYTSAIENFKAATEIQPDFYDAFYNLAVTYDYIGDTSHGIMILETLLTKVPEDFAATYKLGQMYYKKGNVSKSYELMKKIPESAQEFPKAQQFITRMELENKSKVQYGQTKGEVAAKVSQITKNIKGINAPTGIAADGFGNIFVASYADNAIFKLVGEGKPQLYTKSVQLGGPIGLAVDKNNNLYVANYNKNNVLKIDKYGNVSVFIDYSNKPYYLFVKENVLYISEQGSNTVVAKTLN